MNMTTCTHGTRQVVGKSDQSCVGMSDDDAIEEEAAGDDRPLKMIERVKREKTERQERRRNSEAAKE